MDFINNKLPLGNASGALSGYMNKTSTGNPELGYTYNPYEPEKIADLMDAQDSGEGTTGGEGDNSDLVTPSGTPMPGHPDYEAWMTAGGEGHPDGDVTMSDHNGYVGNTFVGIGNALTSLGNVIPGLIGMGLHGVGQGMIGHDTTSIGPGGEGGVGGVDTHTTHGSFDVGEFSDDVATSAHGNAGASSIGTNSFGDTVSVGYGAGQVDPGMAGAAGFSGGGGGTGSSSGGNADFSYGGPPRNNGGPIYGYANGGPIAEQEDPYAPMPLATPMQATPFGGPLRGAPVDSNMETPWYQDVGQSVATSVITGALTKAIGLNKGGKVCPCGTPGCPGCGKGYNHGGPIGSRVSYKEEIARKESAAKIKREDMKAVADVAVKMKGPLQQGV
jgi:hypothetical protein